jgi:hypothetical protein
MLGISDALSIARPEERAAADSDSGEIALGDDVRSQTPEGGAGASRGPHAPVAGDEPGAGPGAEPGTGAGAKASAGAGAGTGTAEHRLSGSDADSEAGAAAVLRRDGVGPAAESGADSGAEPGAGRAKGARGGSGQDWGMRALYTGEGDPDLQMDRGGLAEPAAVGPPGGGLPTPAGGAPGLGEEPLFSEHVTPTDMAQWEEAPTRDRPASEMRSTDPLEEQDTSVYVPTDEVRQTGEHRQLRRQAGLVAAGLLAGVGLIAALMWALWPDRPAEPRFGERSGVSGPEAGKRGSDGAGRDAPGSDESGARARRPIPVVGLELPPDAGIPSEAARARYKQRAIKRWVQFTWRAARDRRYLKPERDCVAFGLQRIEELAPEHEQLDKLRRYTSRRLLWRAARQRRRGKYEEADETLRGLIALAPESDRSTKALASLLVARGRRALRKDKLEEAEAFAKEALSLDEDNKESGPLLLGAAILEARDKLEEARDAYRLVLKKHRRNREARRALRRLRRKLRRR